MVLFVRENGERRPEEPSDNKIGLNLMNERMKKRILQSIHKRVQQGQQESLRQMSVIKRASNVPEASLP